MKVKRLHLQNYGRFDDLNIDFAPTAEKTGNVTVIVGNNGAGKSQILQALATGLSWFVNGLLYYTEESVSNTMKHSDTIVFPHEGEYINQHRITKNRDKVDLGLLFSDMNNEVKGFNLNVTREDILKPAVYGTSDNGFNYLIKKYVEIFESSKKSSLPLIANYTIDRNVEINSIEASYSFVLDQLSAYKDFLNAGSNYDEFFEWFRDNEDVENEISKNRTQSKELDSIENQLHKLRMEKEVIEEIINDVGTEKEMFLYRSLAKLTAEIDYKQSEINQFLIRSDMLNASISKGFKSQLDYVRSAIERFTNFRNIRIRRLNKPTMIVEKNNQEYDINQLSQGERSLLALVGDIARRLVILNPSLDNPLEGEGVVMIDEVDLHLHPKWQHDLIDKFVKTFPNVQFILTTHSPHVISDRPDILVYALDDGELTQVPNIYGEDVNTVLTKVFDVPIRDPEAQADFDNVAELIYQKNFESAENYIIKLEKQMPENLELLRCRLHLTQAQLAAKKEG
ncbi:MAG: putative ATP-binding protein involved in virulence [Psychrobacter glaciei]|jgi:predicted ATP-binding protein involved in virulence|uniref:AAA family ATPase n=1 Tax=Psychrobacter glaciei TaxID=619771 RepID=UPI0039E4C5BA